MLDIRSEGQLLLASCLGIDLMNVALVCLKQDRRAVAGPVGRTRRIFGGKLTMLLSICGEDEDADGL